MVTGAFQYEGRTPTKWMVLVGPGYSSAAWFWNVVYDAWFWKVAFGWHLMGIWLASGGRLADVSCNHLCQPLSLIAKQTYLDGMPPITPPCISRRVWGHLEAAGGGGKWALWLGRQKWGETIFHCWCDFHFSLSVSEFTFTVCVRIYIRCLCQNLHSLSVSEFTSP